MRMLPIPITTVLPPTRMMITPTSNRLILQTQFPLWWKVEITLHKPLLPSSGINKIPYSAIHLPTGLVMYMLANEGRWGNLLVHSSEYLTRSVLLLTSFECTGALQALLTIK
jgi:hypothetical protein